MKKLLLAGLALGLMSTTVLAQADRLAIQSETGQQRHARLDVGAVLSRFHRLHHGGSRRHRECDPARAARPAAAYCRPGMSPHPAARARRSAAARAALPATSWRASKYEQNLGYTFSYPYFLPKGIGGVPSVALDSKGNLWVFKRSPVGVTQLMKFDANHKLMLEVP
jgi:hypothetical protein